MKNIRLLAIIGILVIAGFFIYNKMGSTEDNKPSNGDKQEIVIGYPYLRIALPVIIAYEEGFFEEEGLEVTLKPYQTAQPMMDALVSGKIDAGGFCALPITFGAMARSKSELLFLGGMYEDDNFPISQLIIKDTANIKSILDLKNKKIGILPTRAYEVWLQGILEANNVDPKEVIIRQIRPNLQADALNNGSIDALFTNDPAATITITKGFGTAFTNEALVPKSTGINPFYFGSFNIRKDFGDSNPEVVEKIARALDKASDHIMSYPDSKTVMAQKDYLPEAFRNIVVNFPNSNFYRCNEVPKDALDQMKAYYLEKQILPVDIDLTDLQFHRSN